MKEIIEFLNDAKFYFLATIDDEKPRVRPFGAHIEYEGKIYFCTNNQKKVYNQIISNPFVEISGVDSNGRWIRLSGEAVIDDRIEVKKKMIEVNPILSSLYKVEDKIFTVFYLKNPQATLFSFTGEPKRIL